MSRFRAVSPHVMDGANDAPLLREARSFAASHRTCMVCRARPASVTMCRDDRRVAVCLECHDPASARARAERAARMKAIVDRM